MKMIVMLKLKRLNIILLLTHLLYAFFLSACVDPFAIARAQSPPKSNPAFEKFLSHFPRRDLPLRVPMESDPGNVPAGENSVRLPPELAERFLGSNAAKFESEAFSRNHPILKHFNFPQFENATYHPYARLRDMKGLVPIVFYLSNNRCLYFGLALFTRNGDFVDQAFVAGQEEGSDVVYILNALLSDEVVRLNFSHWGRRDDTDAGMSLLDSRQETLLIGEKGINRQR